MIKQWWSFVSCHEFGYILLGIATRKSRAFFYERRHRWMTERLVEETQTCALPTLPPIFSPPPDTFPFPPQSPPPPSHSILLRDTGEQSLFLVLGNALLSTSLVLSQTQASFRRLVKKKSGAQWRRVLNCYSTYWENIPRTVLRSRSWPTGGNHCDVT